MTQADVRTNELVSVERGEVDRIIFSSEDIFEQELELIFARSWQFLCHESQIPKTGDFFETPIGRDNVLSVRQKDGSIKALLNTCMHKGNAVCRAEEGNTKVFMCTYHGWTYDLEGNLIGVPDADRFFKGRLDKSQHGLREVAQVANYHGFVFATMDKTAPPLEEFLGATGRLAIDLMAVRDIEIVPGIQKFTIECNWKIAAENAMDWYHPQITHLSAAAAGLFAPTPGQLGEDGGATDTLGHSLDLPTNLGVSDEIAIFGEYGHAISGPSIDGLPPNSGANHEWRKTTQAKKLLGPIGVRSFGHPNIFPNAWITQGLQLSLRIPVTASKTEVWWFSFVEKGISAEDRKRAIAGHVHAFGPAGFLEQDDGENWSQATLQSRGHSSRDIPQLLKMDIGHGAIIKEHGLARTEGATSEHGQMWLYHSWAQWMKGLGWEALSSATTPPDVL
jgi:3-phenylpropionate/trans-cinnamate dioxygenase alpha subunit